jgi:hypothetical protein
MKTKRATEYDVRILDAGGDVEDVHHFDTELAAITFAEKLHGTGKPAAIAVERHEFNRDFCCRLRDAVEHFQVIACFGSVEALREWGHDPFGCPECQGSGRNDSGLCGSCEGYGSLVTPFQLISV